MGGTLEEEEPFPIASVEAPLGRRLQQAHQLRLHSAARVCLAPTPGRMQQAAVTPHSIFGIHWTLVILSNPWWTPGLSQLKVCTLPQSREHCHPPAAQLQLKYDLQRARVPLPLPQTRKCLAAKPEGGDRR